MLDQEDNEFVRRKSIATFNDLSSEIILCILKYLSVPDRYRSFFEYDTRLNQLVKQRTSYSRKALDADILRFSTLHSWYKLPVDDGGMIFYIYPRQGQEAYNSMTPTNSSDLHWWFIRNVYELKFTDERVSEIVKRHSFRLTPFFYHRITNDHRNSSSDDRTHTFVGGYIITMCRFSDRETLKQWLQDYYPEHVDRILNEKSSSNDINKACTPVFEAEWIRLTKIIRDAAYAVWEELRLLEDLNPLEIKSISW